MEEIDFTHSCQEDSDRTGDKETNENSHVTFKEEDNLTEKLSFEETVLKEYFESDKSDRKLSKAEKKDIEKAFKRLDAIDGQMDERIEINKLIKIILRIECKDNFIYLGRQIKKKIKEDELKKLVITVDKDHDGFISKAEFTEFCESMKKNDYARSMSKEQGLKDYFQVLSRARVIIKWPPPFYIPIVCLIQLIFFIIDITGVASFQLLIFVSSRRYEIWRYLSYCLVHKDYEHIIANLGLQLVVGIPLELEHKAHRISFIYILGVLSGSLGSYCFDPLHSLMGASGGVYSLIAANLSTLVLNWKEDTAVIVPRVRTERVAHASDGKLLRILKLVAIFLFCLFDIGYALYRRYSEPGMEQGVSYVAHIVGALTGLLVGFIVLKDRNERNWEKALKKVSGALCLLCFLTGAIYNAVVTTPPV